MPERQIVNPPTYFVNIFNFSLNLLIDEKTCRVSDRKVVDVDADAQKHAKFKINGELFTRITIYHKASALSGSILD